MKTGYDFKCKIIFTAAKPPMNPKLQASGRLGGKAGKGQAKVRPLTSSKASEMAKSRWAFHNMTKRNPEDPVAGKDY